MYLFVWFPHSRALLLHWHYVKCLLPIVHNCHCFRGTPTWEGSITSPSSSDTGDLLPLLYTVCIFLNWMYTRSSSCGVTSSLRHVHRSLHPVLPLHGIAPSMSCICTPTHCAVFSHRWPWLKRFSELKVSPKRGLHRSMAPCLKLHMQVYKCLNSSPYIEWILIGTSSVSTKSFEAYNLLQGRWVCGFECIYPTVILF